MNASTGPQTRVERTEEVAARVDRPQRASRAAAVLFLLAGAVMFVVAFVPHGPVMTALVVVFAALFFAGAALMWRATSTDAAPEEQDAHDRALSVIEAHERAPHVSRWAQTHP